MSITPPILGINLWFPLMPRVWRDRTYAVLSSQRSGKPDLVTDEAELLSKNTPFEEKGLLPGRMQYLYHAWLIWQI